MANAQLGYTFLPTSRGGRYLCMGGYMYRVNKRRREEWISWKCIAKDCNATMSSVNDVPSRLPSDHNHPPSRADVKAKETIADLKIQAATSLTPIPTLYDEAVSSLRDGAWTPENRAAVQAMPSYTSTKHTLYRARRSTFPKLPAHRRDLEIPQEFQETDAGEQFLFINDGADDKILGFTTMTNLQHLTAADTIFADGTFYVVPKLFYQLYTFHARIDNKMYPLVYLLLLPDKKTETYLRAFRLLKTTAANRGLQLEPQHIQMDYEAAAKIAAANVFPTSTCFLKRGLTLRLTTKVVFVGFI